MAVYIVGIRPKKAKFDSLGDQVRNELLELGESPARARVESNPLYRIEGDVSKREIETLCRDLLVDPILQTARISEEGSPLKKGGKGWIVDIWPKKGVTDPVGETVQKGFHDLGLMKDVQVTSAHRYIFPHMQDEDRLNTLARRSLGNALIHDIHIRKTDKPN